MKPRNWVILGLGLAVLIVAAALVVNLMPASTLASNTNDPTTRAPASSAPAAASQKASSAAKTTASSPPAGSTASRPAKSSSAPTANPKAPASTPDPKRPLEVAAPAQTRANISLPPSKPHAALVSSPLPKAASATGKIVAGFPSAVLPLAPGSHVSSSSVSPQGKTLQVSLVAATTTEPLAVMQFYQTHLAALGLSAAQAPANAGSTAMWFTRGADKITITATAAKGGGTKYIVFGVLHADS
jgi:cytoskeletal protein RodZ